MAVGRLTSVDTSPVPGRESLLITDGFGEIRSNATPVNHRLIGKLITTPGAVNPTYSWTSPRNAASTLAVAEQNVETFKPQVVSL